MNLKVRFTGKAIAVMEEAMEIAKEDGAIRVTRYKEFNGDLYLDIPASEVDLWLEVFDLMEQDFEEGEPELALLQSVRAKFEKFADEMPISEELISSYEDREVGDELGTGPSSESGSTGKPSSGYSPAAGMRWLS